MSVKFEGECSRPINYAWPLMPGIVATVECPKCGHVYEMDLGVHCLFPHAPVDEWFDGNLECLECGHSRDETIKITCITTVSAKA